MECSLLNKLELTTRKTLSWKVMSEKEMWFKVAQHPAIASPQSKMKFYKRLRDRSNEKDRAGSSSSGGGESISLGRERKRK